jgi:hypothetical protein
MATVNVAIVQRFNTLKKTIVHQSLAMLDGPGSVAGVRGAYDSLARNSPVTDQQLDSHDRLPGSNRILRTNYFEKANCGRKAACPSAAQHQTVLL